MKIYTVGTKSFVTSFQLAGVSGIVSDNSQQALEQIRRLAADQSVGLVLIADTIASEISEELTVLRTQTSALVFALPAAGSGKEDVDYRAMLKKILGV